MSTLNKVISVLLVVLALIVSVVQNVVNVPDGIDNLVDIAAASGGNTVVSQIDDGKIVIKLVDSKGVLDKEVRIPQTKGEETSVIADMAVDNNNRVYLIRDYMDARTGNYLRQDMEVYDMDKMFSKRLSQHPLDNDHAVRYRWINLSSVVVLMGTNPTEDMLYRIAFDPDNAASGGTLASKGERSYSIDTKEGIYEAVPAAQKAVYATKSGKVFVATENAKAKEIYPARVLNTLMYPMYISPVDGDKILMGEQESGDIVYLDIETGATETVTQGSERFTGVSDYIAKDILRMSAIDKDNYSAVVKNDITGCYELLVNELGNSKVIPELKSGFFNSLMAVLIDAVILGAIFFAVYYAVSFMAHQVRESRTILLKLAFSAVPLLIVSFILFGIFSFRFYSDSVEGSFQKQVRDEGNLLTALFGTESFNELEFPYDYTKEGYSYLIQQMNTRDVYTRTAYYENRTLYTGVDKELPCFYPLDILLNKGAVELYEQAAYTGIAQSGIIEDRLGKRLSCVTPIGGVDGGTVYLLETGISVENMKDYTNQYLWRYVVVAVSFTAVIGVLLLLVFTRILGPLADIKTVLEAFSKGNRKVRMESSTKDELSDISRVFNKMADDIDIQLYNLKSISDTYYRFVPQRIFRLLGKDNLGDLELGNNVSGRYNVLCAELNLSGSGMEKGAETEVINRFFNIINEVSDRYDASLVVDSINLCSLKIICREDGEKGVNIALSALAQIDSYNSSVGLKNRMNAMFLLHRTDIYYGICGNEERYIPAMISMELEALTGKMDLLRQFSSRLIVTESAFNTIEGKNYYSRFIGKPEDKQFKDLGLYDFYDESSPEIIRLINNTRSTFDKAIELYNEKRYYDAKNLFAVVLRENQYDNVARYYIFQCEKKI